MALIQVRDVPEDELRELKARAAAEGRSLNGFMRELIRQEVATPTVDEVLRRATEYADRASESSVESIRAERTRRADELDPRSAAEPRGR